MEPTLRAVHPGAWTKPTRFACGLTRRWTSWMSARVARVAALALEE
jgi:hypothetical protein